MNILDTIVAHKRTEIARLPATPDAAAGLRAAMCARSDRRDFLAALKNPPRGDVALIAEIKKASPSAGIICAEFDPVRIARQYHATGAACLSVLTDEKFFQGSLDYLRQVRAAVPIPLLRKDFIIDLRQIEQAATAGADAILLIVRILSQTDLAQFHAAATDAGLTVLVEVHDEIELNRALAVGATLIGVNNRNLDTFTVDVSLTARLAAAIPTPARAAITLVSESGIHNRSDVTRLRLAGANAILVGESLMKNPAAIPAKVAELLDF